MTLLRWASEPPRKKIRHNPHPRIEGVPQYRSAARRHDRSNRRSATAVLRSRWGWLRVIEMCARSADRGVLLVFQFRLARRVAQTSTNGPTSMESTSNPADVTALLNRRGCHTMYQPSPCTQPMRRPKTRTVSGRRHGHLRTPVRPRAAGVDRLGCRRGTRPSSRRLIQLLRARRRTVLTGAVRSWS